MNDRMILKTVPEIIKSDLVRELMIRCLFRADEIYGGQPPADALLVEGILGRYGFHRGRIAESRDEIRWLLDEMPDDFHVQGGGGMSFLNLCVDRNDQHWAEHRTMNELLCLGIAANMADYCVPRHLWSAFPGGMPYVVFDTREGQVERD